MTANRSRSAIALSFVAISATIPLAACAQQNGDDDTASAETRHLVYANALAASDPYNVCGVSQIPELLEASGAGLTMDVFTDSQVHGSTPQQLDALASGQLDITLGAPNQIAAWDERFSVLDAMYLFDDRDHLRRVIDGPIGEELIDGLVEVGGLRVLGWGYYGTRHLTANVPVHSPEDLAGVKLRSTEGALSTYNAEVLGGNPVPVAFPELYIALQQGVADAQENPIPSTAANGFEEVQDYLILTAHNIQYFPTVISESSWQSLSAEQQDALQAAVETALDGVAECQDSDVEELLTEWSAADSPIEVIDEVDLDAFRDRAETMYPGPFSDAWQGLYERIRETE